MERRTQRTECTTSTIRECRQGEGEEVARRGGDAERYGVYRCGEVVGREDMSKRPVRNTGERRMTAERQCPESLRMEVFPKPYQMASAHWVCDMAVVIVTLTVDFAE